MGQSASAKERTEDDEKMEDEHAEINDAFQKAKSLSIAGRTGTGLMSVTGRYHRARKLEDDYVRTTEELGSGRSGKTIVIRSLTDNAVTYASKGFRLHGISEQKMKAIANELEIFIGMDHPHVVRLLDVYESECYLDLVMEVMTGGELFQRVVEIQNFTEADAAHLLWQMLLAVSYIHSHNVVHRDIKLNDFLFDSKDSIHLKLIDFGMSKTVWSNCLTLKVSCGTLAYCAPEVVDKSGYTSQCDLWSLGVSAFVLLFGYMPFRGTDAEQRRDIAAGRYEVNPKLWDRVSIQAQDFVKSLLTRDPAARLTAKQALDHPWILERHAMENQEDHLDKSVIDSLIGFSEVSDFRRQCLDMMAWSLTNEERATVREAFLEMDTDHSGSLSAAEFKQAIEGKFDIHDEGVKQAFACMHSDQTDEIHYSDFLAAMMSQRIAFHDDLLHATFQRFDTANTGFISREDLMHVFGDSYSDDDIEQMVHEIDEDQNGKVSYHDFIHYLKSGSAPDHISQAASKLIDHAIGQSETKPRTCASKSPNAKLPAPWLAACCWTRDSDDEFKAAGRPYKFASPFDGITPR